jgi:DNA-binding MarR family transcriptional regulator
MSDSAPCANVLGAVALVVTDQSAAALAEGARTAGTDLSASAASALSALAEFLDRPTLDQLRQVLGLTPSGVVRLVDRLAMAGLVTRGPGSDGRSRAVMLTERGQLAAGRLRSARLASLQGMLTGLSAAEQQTLHRLLGRVMGTIVEQKSGGPWICRQCDFAACERAAGRCPAQIAAKSKYDAP